MQFSIVIPTYNRSGFLVEAVESVLAQTYQDFEVVIIDDGSTDDTEVVIANKYSGNPKIVYVKQKNSERGVARNHGIRISKGDYVVFLDSDDWFYPNHLEVLHKSILKYPEINFFSTKNDFNDGEHIFTTDIKHIPAGIYGIEVVLRGNPLACNICAKRNNPNLVLFQQYLFTMEDWIFLIQNLRNDKILLIENYTVTMREHPQRSMRSNRSVILKRREAMDFIVDTVTLSDNEKRQIEAYSYYFCSIHCYIEGETKRGFKYIFKAIDTYGFKPEFVILIIKLVIGKPLISKLRFLKRVF